MILEKQATFSEKYRSFFGKGATFSEESVRVAQQNGVCVAGFADVGRGEMRDFGRSQGQMGVQAITITTNALIAAFCLVKMPK